MKSVFQQMENNNTDDQMGDEYLSDLFIRINNNEFRLLSDFVHEHSGINITESKRTLLMGRLQKILQENKCKDFTHYYNMLQADPTGKMCTQLVDAISTNHTFFWRENDHFDFLKAQVLPEIVQKLKQTDSRDLRLWSAGCSSGEEPYNIIMMLLEYFGFDYKNWTAGILATDISDKILKMAETGIYSADKVKQMPDNMLKRYFILTKDNQYQIKDFVRKEVVFRHFNLMRDSFPFKKPFHVIFCRNVMIYFDEPTRDALIKKFATCLEPGGYLFIGHSETIKTNRDILEFVMPAIYRRI